MGRDPETEKMIGFSSKNDTFLVFQTNGFVKLDGRWGVDSDILF